MAGRPTSTDGAQVFISRQGRYVEVTLSKGWKTELVLSEYEWQELVAALVYADSNLQDQLPRVPSKFVYHNNVGGQTDIEAEGTAGTSLWSIKRSQTKPEEEVVFEVTAGRDSAEFTFEHSFLSDFAYQLRTI